MIDQSNDGLLHPESHKAPATAEVPAEVVAETPAETVVEKVVKAVSSRSKAKK